MKAASDELRVDVPEGDRQGGQHRERGAHRLHGALDDRGRRLALEEAQVGPRFTQPRESRHRQADAEEFGRVLEPDRKPWCGRRHAVQHVPEEGFEFGFAD